MFIKAMYGGREGYWGVGSGRTKSFEHSREQCFFTPMDNFLAFSYILFMYCIQVVC